MLYFLCFMLFCVGLYAVVTKKNLLKIVIGIAIMEYAVNLFLIIVGYKSGGEAPFFIERLANAVKVDPLPQAFALITILIGLAVLTLMIAICIRLYEKYGTLDITQIRKLKG